MNNSRRCLTVLILLAALAARAGEVPGPAPDELFIATFEVLGMAGASGGSSEQVGIVVPEDGLPVLLQEDAGTLYLAKCFRLDCGTGATAYEVGPYFPRRATLARGGDGLPLLAYFDPTTSSTVLVHCTDSTCATRTNVTLFNGAAIDTVIAVDQNGLASIAALANPTGSGIELLLVRCIDEACSSVSAPITVVPEPAASQIGFSLIEGANPIVVFVSFEPALVSGPDMRTLHVVVCETNDCSTNVSNVEVVLTPPYSFILPNEVGIVAAPNERPVIFGRAQLDEDAVVVNRLVVIACNNDECSDHEDPDILDDDRSYPADSMALSVQLGLDDLPMVLIESDGVSDFLRCQTPRCGGDNSHVALLNTGAGATFLPALATAADGYPIIAFDRGFGYGMGILHCSDSQCSSWRRF